MFTRRELLFYYKPKLESPFNFLFAIKSQMFATLIGFERKSVFEDTTSSKDFGLVKYKWSYLSQIF